jgi:cyclohexadieny/prephenate dehydrogenase
VTPVFQRIAVVGLGLLGGSVGLAAKARGAAATVIGATRSQDARARALRAGAVDEVREPVDAVRGADLVVLATPVYAMQDVAVALRPGLSDGAIVTDVGSVKGVVSERLPGSLPEGVAWVGSHPMAGSHERGIEAARADLFEGAVCVVTAAGDAAAAERVADFWRALGARVIARDPARHDAEVAWTSHLPHLLAFAFARALEAAPAGWRDVVGSGFRDFTRIAHSDGELWSDILTANRKALAAPLEAFGDSLQELARALEAGDADALEALLAAARRSLSRAASADPAGARSADTKPSSPDRRGVTPGRSKQAS